jgi:hypothetical protein
VGFRDLNASSRLMLIQLEAVCKILEELTATGGRVSGSSGSMSAAVLPPAAATESPQKYVMRPAATEAGAVIDDDNEVNNDDNNKAGLPEDDSTAVRQNEAKADDYEALANNLAASNLPDIMTCHVAIAIPGGDSTIGQLDHRLPDVVFGTPPLARGRGHHHHHVGGLGPLSSGDVRSILSAGRHQLATVDNAGLPTNKEAPQHVSSSLVVADAKNRNHLVRRGFRIGANTTSDHQHADGHHHHVGGVAWRQAGTELATIAESLLMAGTTSRLQAVNTATAVMPLAGGGFVMEDEEDSSSVALMMMRSGMEAVEAVEVISGLLLAVMARALLYVCLSRLKRSMF